MDDLKIKFPGTPGGPCKSQNCEHKKCSLIWTLAASRCVYCGDEIGFGDPYYMEQDSDPAHLECLEERINYHLLERLKWN